MNREQRRASKFKRGHHWMSDPQTCNALLELRQAQAETVLRPLVISTPIEEAEIVTLRVQIEQAWEALRTFTGTPTDWGLLATSINDATVRAESISELLGTPLERAAAAMERMRDRYHAGHALGPDAEALQSIPEAIAIFDEILINSSPKQMMDAAYEVQARIKKQQAEQRTQ